MDAQPTLPRVDGTRYTARPGVIIARGPHASAGVDGDEGGGEPVPGGPLRWAMIPR